MAYFTFDDRHRLGHPQIDEQHRALFTAVNDLHEELVQGGGRRDLERRLGELRDQTLRHFQQEEELMEQSGFPDFQVHQHHHQQLAAQVMELEAKHRQGKLVLSPPVMHFLKDWLCQHITSEDRRLAAFLAEAGG